MLDPDVMLDASAKVSKSNGNINKQKSRWMFWPLYNRDSASGTCIPPFLSYLLSRCTCGSHDEGFESEIVRDGRIVYLSETCLV